MDSPLNLYQAQVVVSYETPTYVCAGSKFEPFKCSSPSARSHHSMVADKHYAHIFGGVNSTATGTLPDLWRFSKLTRNWKRLETSGSAPTLVVSNCMVQLDSGNLLVFGGTGFPIGEQISNKMYTCNLETLHWEEVVYANDAGDGQIPEPAFGQAMVLDRENECLYLSGGTNSTNHYNYNLCIHRFDLATRRWVKLAAYCDVDRPRYYHGMALYHDKLFIICGGTVDEAFRNDKIPIFSIPTRKWHVSKARCWRNPQKRRKKCYPEPRYGHGCVQQNNLVFVVGGQNSVAIFEDVWTLNLDKLSWVKHPDMYMPSGSFYHACTISPLGELLINGGVISHGKEKRTNRFLRTWIQPPPLVVMTKEAVRDGMEHKRNRKYGCKPLRKTNLEQIEEALAGINLNVMDLPYF